MLSRAALRVAASPASVELQRMDVTSLDFPDGYFDAAVATFLFCVLPEELHLPALRELGRVVRPDGTIRFLEYVRPHGTVQRAVSRLWEPWIGWAYGASFDRDVEKHITAAGLEPIDVHFVFSDLIKLIEARPRGR
jgi:SAM-dependent methyltransferase